MIVQRVPFDNTVALSLKITQRPCCEQFHVILFLLNYTHQLHQHAEGSRHLPMDITAQLSKKLLMFRSQQETLVHV